ncbi:MAG: phenylacetate--CoA ligase family protein [Armatimonadota bacterium]
MNLQQLYFALPVWVQEAALSQYGRYLDRLYYGAGYDRWREHFDMTEWSTSAQMQEYQLEALRKILGTALRTVPWFHELAHEGFHIHDLKTLEDLRRLPIMEKEPIRQDPWRFVREDYQRKRLVVHKTSGTTGKSLHIYWSREGLPWWWALHEERVRRWAGVSQALPRAMIGGRPIVRGSTTAPPFWRFNRHWRQLYMSSYHISPTTAPHYIGALRRYGSRWITGYGSAISLLGEHLLEQPAELDIKAVLTSGDTVTPRQRQAIEEGFRTRMFDYYGSAEGCCVISECERGSLHVQPEAGILEILGEEGNPCPPGVEGEFICTGLGNDAMPLVRYRTGDYGCWSKRPKCACGRQSPLVGHITGRTDDYLVLPDGRRQGRLSTAMKQAPSVKQAQLAQDAPDHAWLLVVPDAGYRDEDGKALLDDLFSRIGSHAIRIDVRPVREIPPTSVGKHILVRRLLDDPALQEAYRALIARGVDE